MTGKSNFILGQSGKPECWYGYVGRRWEVDAIGFSVDSSFSLRNERMDQKGERLGDRDKFYEVKIGRLDLLL